MNLSPPDAVAQYENSRKNMIYYEIIRILIINLAKMQNLSLISVQLACHVSIGLNIFKNA